MASAHQYKKNELVFQVGSPGNNIYLLLDGRIKIYELSPQGKEIILWFCFPGEVFGLAEVPRGGRREVYAQACSECEVATISQHEFKCFIATHPSAAMLVIDLLACRLRVLGDMLLNLTADDVTTRVIKLLTRLSARYGKRMKGNIRLDIYLTHQEIADMIGATRQIVTAMLGVLCRQGVVRIENHCIWIQSQELLESMVRTTALPAGPEFHGHKGLSA